MKKKLMTKNEWQKNFVELSPTFGADNDFIFLTETFLQND